MEPLFFTGLPYMANLSWPPQCERENIEKQAWKIIQMVKSTRQAEIYEWLTSLPPYFDPADWRAQA